MIQQRWQVAKSRATNLYLFLKLVKWETRGKGHPGVSTFGTLVYNALRQEKRYAELPNNNPASKVASCSLLVCRWPKCCCSKILKSPSPQLSTFFVEGSSMVEQEALRCINSGVFDLRWVPGQTLWSFWMLFGILSPKRHAWSSNTWTLRTGRDLPKQKWKVKLWSIKRVRGSVFFVQGFDQRQIHESLWNSTAEVKCEGSVQVYIDNVYIISIKYIIYILYLGSTLLLMECGMPAWQLPWTRFAKSSCGSKDFISQTYSIWREILSLSSPQGGFGRAAVQQGVSPDFVCCDES